ncbi:peptide ABC transporter ATP-binding protein [Agaricicola taiwanensis]|uniref:Peptide ABC transporter ATP-binding protein n=1 Tax=Agaricicola taiwanensis TaxID=591372 RepID=A0A8J2YLH8_9RHOB|nr:DMT family transporter [Agaricicola taiwanensis]GGE50885.1 peptide ABC transporter ATP-binding protein [Agaricicola taiwanensis]
MTRNSGTALRPWPSAAFAGAAAFVVLWSSGFITARLIAPHADPLTFLAVRYVGALTVLTVMALAAGAPWPRGRALFDAAVAGILLHGVYLGLVFWAVAHGLPAGVMGLLAGLQPLLTATAAAPLLGEHVTRRQWWGIAAGFIGAALVLAPRLAVSTGGIPSVALFAGIAAVLAITAGTIWQKRTGATGDLRAMAAVQYAAALVPTVAVAALTEPMRFDITVESMVGLLWSVVGISVGAIFLLLGLIRRGALAQVSALLYLVPGVTALMAWALFGEVLSPVQLGGMVVASFGVALVSIKR